MDLIENGKEYWEIVSRVRCNDSRPLVVKAAINDLNYLVTRTKSSAVRARCFKFIELNQRYSPSNYPSGSGPRRA
jgi:hypothetical protein